MKKLTFIKIALLAALTASNAVQSVAQKNNNEWLVMELGTGLHGIQFAPDAGERHVGYGSLFDAKYMRHLTETWSVSGGLGFATYNARAEYNMIESSQAFDSVNNRAYELRTEYIGFIEKQKLYQIEIPIGATFRINNFITYGDLYLGMGLKFGIPVSSSYKLKKGEYKVAGYYPSLDVKFEDMEEHDFYTVEAKKQNGKTDVTGINMQLYGEILLHHNFSREMSAYAGLYFSYCPLNITKSGDEPIVNTGRTYKSSMNTSQVDKVHLASVGLKAAILLDFRRTFHMSSKSKF